MVPQRLTGAPQHPREPLHLLCLLDGGFAVDNMQLDSTSLPYNLCQHIEDPILKKTYTKDIQ